MRTQGFNLCWRKTDVYHAAPATPTPMGRTLKHCISLLGNYTSFKNSCSGPFTSAIWAEDKNVVRWWKATWPWRWFDGQGCWGFLSACGALSVYSSARPQTPSSLRRTWATRPLPSDCIWQPQVLGVLVGVTWG